MEFINEPKPISFDKGTYSPSCGRCPPDCIDEPCSAYCPCYAGHDIG